MRILTAMLVLLLISSCFTLQASARATDSLHFVSPAAQARYNDLAYSLRCVVCQNQTLAESEAPLAADLRHLIAAQVNHGKTNQQIKRYLVERYGDFILYSPPLSALTIFLWFAPLGFLALALWRLLRRIRRRPQILDK